MVEHWLRDAVNLGERRFEFRLGKRTFEFLIKSYSSMRVIENSIAAAWCGGVTVPFLAH